MWRLVGSALLALPLVFLGCGGENQSKYAQAAVATGVLVAATGVNRAVTKDCWAQCSAGYLCNRESGLCERGECFPACEAGSHCVRDARAVTYCARDPVPAPPPKATSTPPAQQAPQTLPESVPVPAPH